MCILCHGGWAILEHDQDTPSDGPLLRTHETTTFARRSQLGDVDGNLRGADTDTEAIDDASHDKHGDVLGSADDDGANDPEDSSDHDSLLSAQDIREEA